MNSWKNQEKYKAKNKCNKNKGLKSWSIMFLLVIALYWQLFYVPIAVPVALAAAFNRPSTRVTRRLIVVT